MDVTERRIRFCRIMEDLLWALKRYVYAPTLVDRQGILNVVLYGLEKLRAEGFIRTADEVERKLELKPEENER